MLYLHEELGIWCLLLNGLHFPYLGSALLIKFWGFVLLVFFLDWNKMERCGVQVHSVSLPATAAILC